MFQTDVLLRKAFASAVVFDVFNRCWIVLRGEHLDVSQSPMV